MSVRAKLFFTIAAFIVGMGIVFVFITQIVLRDTLHVLVEASRKDEIETISEALADYYASHHESWDGVDRLDWGSLTAGANELPVSILLESRNWGNESGAQNSKILASFGETRASTVKLFGIRSHVQLGGQTIAALYYYDKNVDFMSKLRIGMLDSTTVLLIIGSILFILISLLVAYWLSRRLTKPLRSLIPIIDRLGQGELGIQAPVVTKDEYGKVTEAFNAMSLQLHHAEQIRRNLVADVAHELRTPLTIVQGKLELVQQHGQPIVPESLLPLQDELIRLTRLVDDLHQLSLAEANKLPLDLKPTEMAALLGRIVDRIAPDAENKGIAVDIRLECAADDTIALVDPHRITQVFLNLLVNAVRYTPEGGSVTITIGRVPLQQGNNRHARHNEQREGNRTLLRIEVADTGIGIDAGHLPLLFNRFYRTDTARDRHSGGMGLGLAIAKEFVVAHHGTIAVDSRPGEGTTFIVTLPVADAGSYPAVN